LRTELEKIEKSLPKEYQWEGEGAKREKKKGRVARGIKTGAKFGIQEKRQEKGESLERKREKERQSLRTEWAERKSAGYCLSAIEKRKRTRMRKKERSTTGGTGMPMRKWKE
jgi:hypothetical protein